MADRHHHLHQQQRNSNLHLRIVREIDFFDERKRCKIIIKPTMSQTSQEIMFPDIIKSAILLSSPKKRVLPVQETDVHIQETSLSFFNASNDHRYDQSNRISTDIDSSEGVSVCSNPRMIRLFGVNLMKSSSDNSAMTGINDHLQETNLSFFDASTDHGHDQKKRKTTSNDSLEGVSTFHNDSRIIRLFGVNLLVSGESTRSGTDGYDIDHETKRSKVRGKEKILDTYNQESEIDDKQIFLIAKKLVASRTKCILINENAKKQSGNLSNKRKSRNPNVGPEQQQITAPVVPPLFHPRILEEIQQHGPPVFLFEKKLASSDVKSDQNRLFITRSDKLMGFFTEEERRKVNDKDAILIVITKDTQGYEYTLHLTRWPTLDMIVLKHDWRQLVNANGLQRGDSVHGWGYRRGYEFRLALNIIRKQQ